MKMRIRTVACACAAALMYCTPAALGQNYKMYWADARGSIRRANLNGTHVETVVVGGKPTVLAVDPVGRKVYWCDSHEHRIRRAGLDGSAIEDVVDDTLGESFGLALDLEHGHLYWTGIELRSKQFGRDSPSAQAALRVSCLANFK